jgi:hypothetical protein
MSPFFIGWSPASARPLAGFLARVVLLVLGGLGCLALALASTVNDFGGGDFSGDHDLTGVLIAEPYPLLIQDNGHAVMLSGGGKVGVQDDAAPLNGKRVHVTGGGVKRGSIDMVFVDVLEAAAGDVMAPRRQDLGRWRLTGEICDGKCMLGVMRPGSGLAHKACANVCLTGGVPPVLVTTAPVEGTPFMLMGDANGHGLPDALRDHTGILQAMDGTLYRVGDMLVFLTDVGKAVNP